MRGYLEDLGIIPQSGLYSLLICIRCRCAHDTASNLMSVTLFANNFVPSDTTLNITWKLALHCNVNIVTIARHP